jgi:autotransporter-associated beta strand protein
MKITQKSLLTLAGALLCSHARADVIYSNFLNNTIPLDFNGITINIGNGEINPFFGGLGVANDADLQPFRLGTGGLDTIRNFTHGSVIDAGSISLSTGPGGSANHLGNTFTAGQEGYMGFKLDNNKYGWARVVFTDNTGGAVFKDWAYDNSGSGITVGGIRQVAQNIEITSDLTLGSSLSNSGGTTNLVAGSPGATTLSADHTYTGTTTINSGSTLIINGSTTTSGVTVNGTLGGHGTLTDATIAGSGTVKAGALASLGILAADAIEPTGGLDFDFTFSLANGAPAWDTPNASINDVVRLTDLTNPFAANMNASNVVNVYLNVASLNQGDTFTGGFYTDKPTDFLTNISGATYQYHLFDGVDYVPYSGPLTFGLNTVSIPATFIGGMILGYSTQFTAIPETGSASLLALASLALFRRRRPE